MRQIDRFEKAYRQRMKKIWLLVSIQLLIALALVMVTCVVLKESLLVTAVIFLGLLVFVFISFFFNRESVIEYTERDRRLETIEDEVHNQTICIDIDHMNYYGNNLGVKDNEKMSYKSLYKIMHAQVVKEEDISRFEAFLSPEVIEKCKEEKYQFQTERFLMTIKDDEGSIQEKTMEVKRMSYIQERTNMVEIALTEASESVDLLKKALDETTQLKTALEQAYKLAKQGSEAKGSFLAKMSHEIRTPLNAIIGYLGIAVDERENQEKVNYCIDNSVIASKQLLGIINDVLDISAIESGKMKIANEEFDLKKEISSITTIFYQNARNKNIHFETHIENVTEEWVGGDQLRLNQILMNLLSNAVKFTPEDGLIQLRVYQLHKDEEKVYMQFEISDTGIGMSEEYMSRIFQPFEQEQASTARKFGGSGLGLSITNNLVQMMGGKIEVHSKQKEGTTFIVTLFFDLAKGEHGNTIQTDFSHVRVLVVDDKEDDCAYMKMMLKRCGVKADSVIGGEAALRRIRSRQGSDYSYDMCIIDWNMPEMDGGEVTKRIREQLGETMPIMIATAYDISEFQQEAKAAGADKIISKPLFQSTLFDLLVSNFGAYEPKKKSKDKNLDMTGVHLLLAEDNPMNMDIAVTVLEKAGITVDQAHNGREACEIFLASEKNTYDLILMDIQMPVMDGYEATGVIRNSSHEEAKTIPIIAMTANAFAEDVAEALSKGMNAHIAKPVDYDKLFDVLQKFSDKF